MLPPTRHDIPKVTLKQTLPQREDLPTDLTISLRLEQKRNRLKASLLTPRGNLPSELLRLPPSDESQNDFFIRNSANFLIASANCITDTSHRTYSTGWKVYLRFCLSAAIDPWMVCPPASYIASIAIYDHKVTTIGTFVSYLAFELTLSPSTVSTYVQGVRDSFRREHMSLDCFSHPVLKQLRSAVAIDYRALNDNASDRLTLPFTVEMVVILRDHVINIYDYAQYATFVAVVMAMSMLCRASELIPTVANHFTRAQDVVFHLIDLTTNKPFDCYAHEAFKYTSKQLKGVTTLIRSAKNDQDGNGHKCSFSVLVLSPQCVYCVATIMYHWARIAMPLAEDPFLSHHGGGRARWFLSYASYNDAIKKTALLSGFNPARFSTHSCRIGGATLLAAANHPNHYIQRAGRWKSLAFLNYIRWAVSSMNSALVTLVNPSVFTNADMLKLNPGASYSAWKSSSV